MAAGCGGSGSSQPEAAGEGSFAEGLRLLPDRTELHRHVLVADLERLRRAHSDPEDLRGALVGVWLPDALVAADRGLWSRSFGLRLEDVTLFASGGFHPAEVAVIRGRFDVPGIERALVRSGYAASDGLLGRGEDGSLDVESEAGRLALSSLNRIAVSATALVAASTTGLARAALSVREPLAAHQDFADAATALDPITSAIVLDARLVRPPSGVPVEVVTEHVPLLVAAGLDDAGTGRRTLKIALVYGGAVEAADDARAIERSLDAIALPGAPGTRLVDLAQSWTVSPNGRVLLVSGELRPEWDAGTWRLLVERGDLAPIVKAAPESPGG